MPSRPLARLALLLAGCALATASCTVERRASLNPSELRGWTVQPPLPKPEFVLESMDGGTFDFRAETDGYVTLLFFGYTYCPDVCPLHMANIAAVLRRLTPDITSRVRVVFVTTDPERDTAERLREWLANFNDSFIGLRGDIDEVNAIQRAIGLSASFREEWPNGGYGVAHAAQVLAYTSDNVAHVTYAFGTRQEDWAHDIPRLVKEDPPSGG